MIKIRKGLDLPIAGAPVQAIQDGPNIQHVALLGKSMSECVPPCWCRKAIPLRKARCSKIRKPRVFFTAPASGRIAAINRGERRVLQSVVIALENGGDDQLEFAHYPLGELAQLPREQVESELIASGLWTALRTRPFSKTPSPGSEARAIFVTAMDTQPLAADPQVIIAEQQAAFNAGLLVLARLTTGKVHVCHAAGASVGQQSSPQIAYSEFAGPHPAGLVGTHIHFTEPVSLKKTVWHIGYQTSSPSVRCSPPVSSIPAGSWRWPGRRWRSRRCCALARGQPRGADRRPPERRREPGDLRFGAERHARRRPECWLGRFHSQVSVLEEGRDKELFGWIAPSPNKFSITRTTLGHFLKNKLFAFSTSTHGGERAMVPIGNYERVMPLDILPTLLLRDLLAGDSDSAQALGCLELDEEDLALCTFVCPGKYEYAPVLREC